MFPESGVTYGIDQKSVVQNDEWLNQPLTRLDYILIRMESTITESTAATLEMAGIFFERSAVVGMDPSVDFSVRYSNPTGRIFVMTRLEYVGEPKRPMTEVCEDMINRLEAALPLAPSGYSWNNNALGLLQRDDDSSVYDEIAQTLASSTVLIATVDALYETDDQIGRFVIRCVKQDAAGPILFFRHSKQFR